MPLPNFTDDEQYIVNSTKSASANDHANSYMWSSLIGSVLLAGFGVYHKNMQMMLAAVGLVCVVRIYEERLQSQWLPVWRSVITKYETACTVDSFDSEPKSDVDS